MLLEPARALRHRTTYLVVVTAGARDLAGNRLDQDPTPYRWAAGQLDLPDPVTGSPRPTSSSSASSRVAPSTIWLDGAETDAARPATS